MPGRLSAPIDRSVGEAVATVDGLRSRGILRGELLLPQTSNDDTSDRIMEGDASRLTHHATATVEVTQWERKLYDKVEGGPALSRVSFVHAFSGDIRAEGTLEYLMAIGEGGATSFVGMERVRGRLGDREGSFVLQHSGTFDRGIATVTWVVVPGSGTDELRGLRGRGGFTSEHATRFEVTLDYDLEGL